MYTASLKYMSFVLAVQPNRLLGYPHWLTANYFYSNDFYTTRNIIETFGSHNCTNKDYGLINSVSLFDTYSPM